MKKILSIALVVVLLAGIAISGTMAYLTDTESTTNVMTLGNVDIEQHEYQRKDKTTHTGLLKEGDLVPFKQGQGLYPAVPTAGATNPYTAEATDLFFWGDYVYSGTAGNGLWNDGKLANVLDKMVFVENTGKSDAYYRTIIAFECPEGMDYSEGSDKEFMMNVNGGDLFEWEEAGYATIGGVRYLIEVATYQRALEPGQISHPSLLQVVMTDKATNEDMELLGDTYEILVLSQAVQTAGFENAEEALTAGFGEVTAATAAEWFDGIEYPVIPEGFEVSDNAGFAAAVAAGETEIWLNPGTYTAPAAAKGKTLTINGTKDAVLEVIPAGQGEANGQLDYSFDGSKVTFNGITIKTNSQLYAGYARLSGTYNNCVIQNTYNLGTGNSAFYNCEINITNEYLRVGGASSAIFDGCTFNTDGRAILVFQDGTNVAQTVTVKDCTFNATAPANTWNGIHVAAVSIDGSQGGTYVVNLEGTNTVDSDFNGLWQIKAGNDKVTVNE